MNEIALMCNEILKWKPDVVITEKVDHNYHSNRECQISPNTTY